MGSETIVISINASWNIVNFRMELIAALQARGFRVVALAPPDRHSAQLVARGIEFHPIDIDSKSLSPLDGVRLVARYRRALRKIRPAVFLGYTIKPNIFGSLAAQSLGIATINNISGLGTAFIGAGWLTRVVTFLYRIALRRSATVFFQNADDLGLFVSRDIVDPDQARLLPGSGIDLTHFAPVPRKPSKDFVFLFLGRLLWDKGIAEFVEAARIVRDQAPQARFRMLGFVDAANRTAVPQTDIEAWAGEGLIDHIPACDDVRPHIAAADCIVLPSYREGLPRALLEGAAMAKPLIATDVPGCRDVVAHDVNGLLCKVRDSSSLARSMLTMLDAPPLARRRMGEAGRRRVEERFDHRIVVEQYLEAIERALATGSSAMISPPRDGAPRIAADRGPGAGGQPDARRPSRPGTSRTPR